MTEKNNLSFEDAFQRLEGILEDLNKEKVSLEDSIKLFEEADKLISKCGKQLTEAEKKIETLIKNRDGELVLDENSKPLAEEFAPSSQHFFKEDEE